MSRMDSACEVVIPTYVETVPSAHDYEPAFEAKRRMLRSGEGLRRGKNTTLIGEERHDRQQRAFPFLVLGPRVLRNDGAPVDYYAHEPVKAPEIPVDFDGLPAC